MGANGIKICVKIIYPDRKSDLFAVFIEKMWKKAKKNGNQAMITHSNHFLILSGLKKIKNSIY